MRPSVLQHVRKPTARMVAHVSRAVTHLCAHASQDIKACDVSTLLSEMYRDIHSQITQVLEFISVKSVMCACRNYRECVKDFKNCMCHVLQLMRQTLLCIC